MCFGAPFCYFVDGIDFFYASKSDARKLVDFLLSVVPCKCVGVGWGCRFEEVPLARAVYVHMYVRIYTALDMWYRRHVFCGYGMLFAQ